MVAGKVAAHLEDFAAVAAEHGDETVADMLTGVASVYRSDDLHSLIESATDMIAGTTKIDVTEASTIEGLANIATLRADRVRARARVEELIAEAWLREGYSSPQVSYEQVA